MHQGMNIFFLCNDLRLKITWRRHTIRERTLSSFAATETVHIMEGTRYQGMERFFLREKLMGITRLNRTFGVWHNADGLFMGVLFVGPSNTQTSQSEPCFP